jgi:hypothetical protein
MRPCGRVLTVAATELRDDAFSRPRAGKANAYRSSARAHPLLSSLRNVHLFSGRFPPIAKSIAPDHLLHPFLLRVISYHRPLTHLYRRNGTLISNPRRRTSQSDAEKMTSVPSQLSVARQCPTRGQTASWRTQAKNLRTVAR